MLNQNAMSSTLYLISSRKTKSFHRVEVGLLSDTNADSSKFYISNNIHFFIRASKIEVQTGCS